MSIYLMASKQLIATKPDNYYRFLIGAVRTLSKCIVSGKTLGRLPACNLCGTLDRVRQGTPSD